MKERIDIPAGLYDDEIVCFLADRYHATPRDVVQRFLVQDGFIPEAEGSSAVLRLEDNEMEMMRGLTDGGHS